MFIVLVDTCVWLDLAKDTRQAPVLGVVKEMIKQKLITLLVPRAACSTSSAGTATRIVAESTKSLSSHFRVVKDAVGRVGGDKRRMRAVIVAPRGRAPQDCRSSAAQRDQRPGPYRKAAHGLRRPIEAHRCSQAARGSAGDRQTSSVSIVIETRWPMRMLIETYGERVQRQGRRGQSIRIRHAQQARLQRRQREPEAAAS